MNRGLCLGWYRRRAGQNGEKLDTDTPCQPGGPDHQGQSESAKVRTKEIGKRLHQEAGPAG